jgi:4-hydroxyacetophenone monooxygenase
MNDVVDKNDLRPHMVFDTSCLGAKWDESSSTWQVKFRNNKTGHSYSRTTRMFVSATGFFSLPKYPEIQGQDVYQGPTWHSSRWDHSVNLTGKNIAVIGNGCSGCQVIPAIAPKVKSITHYARSKQWLFARVSVLARFQARY